ncbi:MAG: CoA pyrophosphatase [bacterium]
MQEVWLADESALLKRVAERLAGVRPDFLEQMHLIEPERLPGRRWLSSGILVPLEYDRAQREPLVILNKRSASVLQPGDLCFPGGGLDRKNDRFLGSLLASRFLPFGASRFLKPVPPGPERDALLTVLATALRESWEEMRLPPWRVEILGALSAHRMQSFPRIIFPLVGRIRGAWKARPNREVEKVLHVPIRALLAPENYGTCSMRVEGSMPAGVEIPDWEVPCLIIPDQGKDEILWGATFKILLTFLETALDFPVSEIRPARKVTRVLPAHYFTGIERQKDAGQAKL